jgi:ABC-2 type transport system permease protein
MNSARAIRLVFARELKARMLTKANIISLAIMLALILGGTITASILKDRSNTVPTVHIALDASAADLASYLTTTAQQSGVELQLTTTTEAEARAILDGTASKNGAINTGAPTATPAPTTTGATPPKLEAFVGGTASSPVVIVGNPNDSRLHGIIAGALQTRALDGAVKAMGGNLSSITAALAQAQPTFESIGKTDAQKYGPAYGVAMVATILLLITLITSAQMIAMGVVEEKSSRVVEILLATIRPTQLLTGKILGVGAYGLFQTAFLGSALTGSLVALGLVDSIPINLGWTLALLVMWFVLGYTIFALLFGAFASLVSRQEDIGAVTTPLTLLVVGPYYLAVFLIPSQPDSTLVRVLSDIPIFAPFMMPMRVALGTVPGWEMALAIALAVATIPAVVWVAARMYQRGILHMGGRLKFSEALRSKA